MGGKMNKPDPEKNHDNWLLLQLWGLDTPITALCWSVAIAALLQITIITPGPMLLVAAATWCAVIFTRLGAALTSETAWQAAFYRSHMALLLVLLFSVSMATVWMLFFQVGQNVLYYVWAPVFFFCLSRLSAAGWYAQLALLFQAIAFALACCLPAYYFSFTLSPVNMLCNGPVWFLGLLFFLTARERQRLRAGNSTPLEAIVTTVTLILLLVAALISSVTAPMFERKLCITIAIGAGCLQGFSRLSTLLPPQAALALSWLAMALPALLGVILYAPHSW